MFFKRTEFLLIPLHVKTKRFNINIFEIKIERIFIDVLENWKKLALKLCIEIPILLYFKNLCTIFCPRLSEETRFFISNSSQIFLSSHLPQIVIIHWKLLLLLNMTFKTTKFWKIPKFDIFHFQIWLELQAQISYCKLFKLKQGSIHFSRQYFF